MFVVYMYPLLIKVPFRGVCIYRGQSANLASDHASCARPLRLFAQIDVFAKPCKQSCKLDNPPYQSKSPINAIKRLLAGIRARA
jgi:hypothetical protein